MSADEHVEEILVHLRGKAKDVVKFWIRNCDSATTVCPNSVYSLLRKHFSCNHYSPVPLADFYTTLPDEDENPYDYWLRLNKAADVASECLREQDDSALDGVDSRLSPIRKTDRSVRKGGQTDEMILGSNAIKSLLTILKNTDDYWRLISLPNGNGENESLEFISLLSNTQRWRGDHVPDKVGTVKLKHSVTLQPQSEHLVWGKRPVSAATSVGSTVLVEPTQSKCSPKQIMVGRVITPLWGDGWIPVKVINPTNSVLTLRRNAKIADVSPCIAVEDLPESDSIKSQVQHFQHENGSKESEDELLQILNDMGLRDLDLTACEVSSTWKMELLHLVKKYESIFSRDKMDCGEAKDFVHRIRLVDDKPFRLPYRRVPPSHYEKLRVALDEMEEKGIIRKSKSEYASPLVLVWKKNGDLRICTDFRWLNARTVKDAHPLPHQSDALAALGGNAFFSTMDLTSGFYNVPLHEDDRKYTAFSSPFGLHEYNRMPQGLCNSPATFMRMMMSIFGDKNFTSLLCYLDDLMVFAPDEHVALERLEMVFSRLKAHNLKLSPRKCHFLRKSVKFLGHVICEHGVKTDPGKIKAITDVKAVDLMNSDGLTPCHKKIRSFLGMVLYYQHFIERCSVKAKPLFDLISKTDTRGSRGRRRKLNSKVTCTKLSPTDWTDKCQEAFDTLKEDLLTSVTLAHPDFNREFLLAIDASFDGLGAVVSQIPEGGTMARPVAFASKTLSRSQMNYPAHRLEFLALKWAVCDKFHHWLKGRHFTAWTDNNPLTYILTKPRLDACEQRWVAKLASFSFDLKYVPGSKNIVADALSREPFVQSSVSHRLVTEPYLSLLNQVNGVVDQVVQDSFRLTTNCQVLSPVDDPSDETGISGQGQLTTGALSSQDVAAVLDAHCSGGVGWMMGVESIPHLVNVDQTTALNVSTLSTAQEQDNTVSRALFYVQRHRRPDKHERSGESRPVIRLLKHWNKLTIRDGMLFRVKKDNHMNKKLHQFIVPDALKQQVLHGLHDAAGHQGRSRTLLLARQRFFWTGMERDIANYVRNCMRCIVGKTPEPKDCAPLENIHTSEPMELICIDFWTAEQGDKSVDVLVATDHFTKLAYAFPCKNQSAKQVAHHLWNGLFCVYGFPRRVHSDQGPSFESKLMKELLEMAGIRKSHTTPYHPMGNGITERFNRTLGNMIRSLPPQSKAKWPQSLQMLTFCYNCTIHETTGFAPFYLMFGRVPRLPIDVMFQHVLRDDTVVRYSDFVSRLKCDLGEAAKIAQKHSSTEQARHARIYNRKVKGSPLTVGDRVLLANRGERGKRKIADKWESNLYEVMSVRSPINVYRIRDTETGREKTVHRNLLLPVNFLYKDEVDLPSHSVDSTSDLPDHPDSDTRTAHWVMQSDQPTCPENDSSDSSALSGVQCSLDVQNSDSDTCNSSVSAEQGSDVGVDAPHLLDEGLVSDEELGQSSSQHSLTLPVFPPSQVVNNPVPDTVNPSRLASSELLNVEI
ncbi:Retrovirus-related Pol polyprotein from transposon 412 [Labeo rohita]|uniref:Gypsy retrotransposon integrase-like protein 1 n=1 Tax=Labeo rohita TaxID=84645 RepID=A0A498P1G8_LABRO|nr:Retrovirus-related Pol polyprotein from transposon 412 [Labeo rohita]